MPAFHGYGTILEVDNDAAVFSPIALVQSINPPTLTRGAIDVTHLSSPSVVVTGGHRERISGVADSGPLSLTIFYDPANATHDNTVTEPRGLIGLWLSGVVRLFRITYSSPGSDIWGPFSGFVSSFAVDGVAVDAAPSATVEITVTTEPAAIA